MSVWRGPTVDWGRAGGLFEGEGTCASDVPARRRLSSALLPSPARAPFPRGCRQSPIYCARGLYPMSVRRCDHNEVHGGAHKPIRGVPTSGYPVFVPIGGAAALSMIREPFREAILAAIGVGQPGRALGLGLHIGKTNGTRSGSVRVFVRSCAAPTNAKRCRSHRRIFGSSIVMTGTTVNQQLRKQPFTLQGYSSGRSW